MKILNEIFSSDGDTQSTAIAALIVQGQLPKPNLVSVDKLHNAKGEMASTHLTITQRH